MRVLRHTAFLLLSGLLLALPARAVNYSDIWYSPTESGWGMTIADHETQLFAVWYTYRADGRPVWFTIPGGTFSGTNRRFFEGDLYQTTGPAYVGPHSPSLVAATKVGTARFDFAPPGLATGYALFTWTVGASSQEEAILRQPFGNAAADWGTDVTDIWWNPNEAGWGLTLAQHGNNVFGVLYIYDTDGQPLWVVMPGVTFNGAGNFTGRLYTTRGPVYSSSPFNPALVQVTDVGTATISVSPNRTLTLASTINGTRYDKSFVVQQPFGLTRPAAGAGACVGSYSVTVDLAPFQCTNSQWTFTGAWSMQGIDFRRNGNFTDAPVAISSITNTFQGSPYQCSPTNEGPIAASATGSISSFLGSGTLRIPFPTDPETLNLQFSLGSMNTVLGTLAGSGVTGRFTCTYP